eukprot:CAMPEP_0178427812 /NCGR_PEP_ID=MMETSP0689_2-20121128/29939_1 /TAXON_ID=160604 /ORGANISM="Amphidinium massartii, Strain CS-259" /LENGTH=205 /DNA_ID=CAMNT_0020049533 /DNA_START=93 /DNA_END=707 /DNA_ORIENTATION=-
MCCLSLLCTAAPAYHISATSRDGPTITKSDKCIPSMLQGVYRDLKDANNKVVSMTSSYGITITPPAPGSKYYVEGIGKDWVVSPEHVGPVSDSCRVVDIDFNVPHKPAPPPGNVSADWVYTPLQEISWVAKCGPATVGSDSCGQAGSYADRSSPTPVFALAFGTFAEAGNVWVKIADAPDDDIIAVKGHAVQTQGHVTASALLLC